ncbi:MAG: hypothetical protein ACXWVS_08285 [Hyphomicrobium sp.]
MSSISSVEGKTAANASVAPSADQEPADRGSPADLPSAPTIEGFIERIEPQRVSGWAWDRRAPGDVLEIEILLDGKSLATTRADRFREDLKKGIGDGCHAFQAFFDTPIPEQSRQRITAVARSRPDGAAIRLVSLVGARLLSPQASAVAVPADSAQANAGARPWLVQLAAAHRRLQATCSQALEEVQKALAAEAARTTEVADTLKELRTAQEQLGQQLAALEVFQARFDTTLKSMEERVTVAGVGGRTDRGLRTAVAAIATISATFLALGLWSIITG